MQRVKRLSLFVIFCIALSGAPFGFAQSSTEPHQIIGYKGTVTVMPNASRQETTIALAMPLIEEGKSNQIVFHVQQVSGVIPAAWTGLASVLSGDGILAIRPEGSSRGILFKFAEREVPESMSRMDFDLYPVYGIARFGERTPLTDSQVKQLARSGRVVDLQKLSNKLGSITLPPGVGIRPADDSGDNPYPVTEPDTCVAGGPGSTSCSASGCTVTCGGAYHSCCNGGTCLCYHN